MSAPPPAPCARCASPLEREDLRCAICGQTAPVPDEAPTKVEVELLRCEGCRAAVSFDPKAQGLACAFCGSVLHLESTADVMEEVELRLPFSVRRAEARAALRAWQKTLGFFRPADLIARSKVEEVRPLWWVGWVFDAEARISWAADSNEGSGRSYWAPHSGQAEMVFDDILVSASRGLSEKETNFLAPHYDLGTAAPPPREKHDEFDATEGNDDLEGAIVERFDVQRSLARRLISAAITRVAAARVERRHVPGTHVRNLHVAPRLRSLDTRRFAFPAWVMSYRYRDTLYRTVVSGQDRTAVTGTAPWSVARVALVAIGGLGLLFVLMVIVVGILATG